MAIEVFANFVETTLADTIGPAATSFTVASGTGATLPQPAAGQFGRLVFTDQLTGALHEVLTYTNVSGDTVSGVTRGTSPLSWSAGDIIECGPTAQTMAEFVQSSQAQQNSFVYAQDTGLVANTYAIALTPAMPTGVAGSIVYFKPAHTNTGASTLTVNAGTTYDLLGSALAALQGGEIFINGFAAAQFDATLGKYVLLFCTGGANQVLNAVASKQAMAFGQNSTVRGARSKLKIAAIGINNTNAVVTADELVVENSAGLYVTLRNVNVTINSAGTVGQPNSLSSGVLAASTAYYVYVWYNGTTVCGMIDPSATAPTAPVGFTAGSYARVGAVLTDPSGNKYLMNTVQYDRIAAYIPLLGSNTPNTAIVASGTIGSINGTLVASSLTGFVPPTAVRVDVGMAIANSGSMQVSSSAVPAIIGGAGITVQSVTGNDNYRVWLTLETQNIYVASNGTPNRATINSWEDNL